MTHFVGQFHVVKTSNKAMAIKYCFPCPARLRDKTGGCAVRKVDGQNIWVSNYEGSAHVMELQGEDIDWTMDIEPGVDVGMVRGVEIM